MRTMMRIAMFVLGCGLLAYATIKVRPEPKIDVATVAQYGLTEQGAAFARICAANFYKFKKTFKTKSIPDGCGCIANKFQDRLGRQGAMSVAVAGDLHDLWLTASFSKLNKTAMDRFRQSIAKKHGLYRGKADRYYQRVVADTIACAMT